MACYIILHDISNRDPETGRPLAIAMPKPFASQQEAQAYLDMHAELWGGSPLFSYGDPAANVITPEWIHNFNELCNKLGLEI